MRVFRSIWLLFLPFAAFASELGAADDVQGRALADPPEPGAARRGVRWVAEAAPPSPLQAPAVREADAARATAPPDVQPPAAPARLTLEELTRIALQSNPTLEQARMAVRAAEGEYVQAGLYPNPVIGYQADEIGNDGAEGLQGAFLAQEIVTAGKLRYGRAAASSRIQQARCAWEAQRRRVVNDVRAGYYEVLLAQKTIDVNEQLVLIGQQGVKVTEQLREAMEVSQTDVLQARIELESAKLSLVRARNFYWAAWRRLAAVLGRPNMGPVPLDGDAAKDLPVLDPADALARLLSESPELGRARAGVERARWRLAYQCAQRIPNVEVGGAAKYDTGSRFAVADVELGVPLPLFQRNQGNIIKARADLTAASEELRRVELNLHARFAAAVEPYANAQQQVETYTRTILPNAQASLDLTRTGYREGEFGYLTLLTAQRTYFNVNLEYLASLQQLWARSIELEGLLLQGGLEAAWSAEGW